MAKKLEFKKLSAYNVREAQSYETWLSLVRMPYRSYINNVELQTASKDIIPEVDLVVVFSDNLRAAAEAAVFFFFYKNQHGKYPKILCLPALNLPEYINFGAPEEKLATLILKNMNVPEDVIIGRRKFWQRYNLVNDLALYLDENPEFQKVLVVSSLGHSLLAAQALCLKMPDIDWVFFENELIAPKDRVLDTEILDVNGIGVDLLIANIAKAFHGWGVERCHLTFRKVNDLPDRELMKNIINLGYVAGLSTDAFCFFDVDEGSVDLMRQRREYIDTLNIGNMKHTMAQINALLRQYKNV